jgi:hypothetical protein
MASARINVATVGARPRSAINGSVVAVITHGK